MTIPKLSRSRVARFATPAGRSACTDLPYTPRVLTNDERSDRDLHVFYSPRNQRIAAVTEVLGFALALRLEFDPSTAFWVERPRLVTVTERRQVELSFWVRDRTGGERFLWLVGAPDTRLLAGGARQARDHDALDAAFHRAGVRCDYVFEAELVEDAPYLSNCLRSLPYAQAYDRLDTATFLREEVRQHFESFPRSTFLAVEAALAQHDPAAVRCVCVRLIFEGVLAYAKAEPLSPQSVLSRVGSAS